MGRSSSSTLKKVSEVPKQSGPSLLVHLAGRRKSYHERACDHDDDAAFSTRWLRIERLDCVFDLFERQILDRTSRQRDALDVSDPKVGYIP